MKGRVIVCYNLCQEAGEGLGYGVLQPLSGSQ